MSAPTSTFAIATSAPSRPTDHRGRFIPDGSWPPGRGAPEPLERVRRFLNTVNPESGADHFETTASLAAWLEREGYGLHGSITEIPIAEMPITGLPITEIPISEGQRARVVELRGALRELAHGNHAPPGAEEDAAPLAVLDALCARLPVLMRFEPGPRLVPTTSGVDAVLVTLLTVVHEAMITGTWVRLKACRNHHCRWAFYDQSKNASGSWCSLKACGSRMKVRAYRARRRAASATPSTPATEERS